LRSVTTNQERETIEELQQTLLELTELAKILRERNAEVEGDPDQITGTACRGDRFFIAKALQQWVKAQAGAA